MRTIFNNIISNNNLEPKNIEYIYILDTIWIPNKLESKIIENYTIVENVEQENSGSYIFNIKNDNDTKYSCAYGWAFVENTKENRKILKKIEKEVLLLEKQENKVKELRNSLTRLYKNENQIKLRKDNS